MAGAARVLAECRTLGITVPVDVAILSCGDFQYVCENQSVPISCIPMNGKRHGYEARRPLVSLRQWIDAVPCLVAIDAFAQVTSPPGMGENRILRKPGSMGEMPASVSNIHSTIAP